MATIVNITSFSVGTPGEELTVSNSGWTKNTSAQSDGSSNMLVATGGTVYAAGAVTAGYQRNETPGSANQTVKATLKRIGSLVGQYVYVYARATDGGDDWIGAGYADGSIILLKTINGSRTAIQAETSVTAPLNATNDTGTLELVCTRVGANNTTVQAFWTGTDATRRQVGSNQSVTDAAVDGVGKVGILNRVSAPASTTGIHITTFYAEDDSAGGGGSTVPLQLVSPKQGFFLASASGR